ncbi:iron chelate uptake ABC transporter family permease subunit [Cellulosilyticum ruminicola]|uniref:iron chelate uptake ABC transporter family permease subunit n=1 Tax=Cellulosilyticum ruminicola TaxID=425254 RepID=UPI0006D1C090|nr:iron chelate uptake ABC transporter family permease subunit [Cellulosilyticum ruminicola]
MKVKAQDKKILVVLIIASITLIALYLLTELNPNAYGYALSRRIPRVYAIILTGAAVGFSSLVFQTITNNHILTPSILGLDSLYMLLNTTVVFLFSSTHKLIVNANTNFLLTTGVMLGTSVIFYKLVFSKKNNNIFFLLLIGVIIGTLFESLTTFMQVLMDPNEFLTIQDKSQASFNNINIKVLTFATIAIVGSFIYSARFMKVLDVMGLGRDQAINLGVDYDKIVKRMLVVIVILTATSTALVGPITFLGLLVVNIARYMMHSYKHSTLSFTILLISIVALVGGQYVAEHLLKFGVSVSIIINFIGGIYFIYLLMKGRTQ